MPIAPTAELMDVAGASQPAGDRNGDPRDPSPHYRESEANMVKAPAWFMPVAIVALLWNLLGCFAFASDLMLTPADVAKMSAEQQALYAARPAWAVAATAVAVIGGALGCIGLILRKRWALPLFVLSLVGVIAQDIGLFVLTDGAKLAGTVAVVLQGVVLLVAIGLVLLARKAIRNGWIA